MIKTNKTMKKSTRWLWMSILLTAMISIGTISCDDDENDNGNLEGEEAAAAWLYGYRLETPGGRVYYMSAHEEIPKEADASDAIELGFNARIYSYGEHPYTWNGDAATITKWGVDKNTLALSPIGIVSFANAGLSGANLAEPIFLSETQAFYTDLTEGIVVEWNPSTMEITEVLSVDPLPSPLLDGMDYSEWTKYLSDGKVMIPIRMGSPDNCCKYPEEEVGAIVAVLDPSTKTVTYHQDMRLISCYYRLLPDVSNGSIYIQPNRDNSFILPYFDVDDSALPHPFALLKLNADGSFDSDFYLDLNEIVPMAYFGVAAFVSDNKLVFNYVDDTHEWPASYDDASSSVSGTAKSSVMVDLETKEVTPFTAFSEYGGVNSLGTVDGVNYYWGYSYFGNGYDEDHLIAQNSAEDFSVVSTVVGGGFQHINKLW